MVIQRGDIWWASLPEPLGSEPGGRRPILVVQADSFNESLIQTTLAIILTSNLMREHAPGNVLLRSHQTGLPKDSVANVSQVATVDRRFLTERVGRLSSALLHQVDEGLRLVLDL